MKKNSALIVVDMQNDFITGVLGSKFAKNIVPRVKKIIDNFDGKFIYATLDYHIKKDYEKSAEGKSIPEHCIMHTEGADFEPSIKEALYIRTNDIDVSYIHKNSFGSLALADMIYEDAIDYNIDTIYIVGLCTDICVLSNALMVRAACPKAKIIVYSNCCAGSSYANHHRALELMNVNCIKTIPYLEV